MSLSQFKFLKQLNIDLEGTNVSDIYQLANSIGKLNKLEQLELKLGQFLLINIFFL